MNVNEYELRKMKNVEENKKKFLQLGLGKYVANPVVPLVQQKTLEKNDGGESPEYVMENESGNESDDTSEVISIY